MALSQVTVATSHNIRENAIFFTVILSITIAVLSRLQKGHGLHLFNACIGLLLNFEISIQLRFIYIAILYPGSPSLTISVQPPTRNECGIYNSGSISKGSLSKGRDGSL
eukprot:548744_1